MLSAVTISTSSSAVLAMSTVARSRCSARRSMTRVTTTRAAAKDDASAAAASAAAPTAVALPRRAALTAALACTFMAPTTTTNTWAAWAADGDAAPSTPSGGTFNGSTREFDFKTYKLTVPDVYEEVNVPLKDPATGVVSPTVMLLKDTRPGQAGNTISLSKQIIPEGGINSVADIGSAQETGERLVAAESARKKGVGGIGGAGASFRSASQRTGAGPGKLLYYTAEYTKSVLSVSRVVLTTLVVADGVLYTLTAEEDQGRFDGEMGDALRAAVASLVVTSQSNPAAAAAARVNTHTTAAAAVAAAPTDAKAAAANTGRKRRSKE